MPLHEDFQKIKSNFVKEYGQESGEKRFYAWLNKNGYDDTKPMPGKKSFLFADLEIKSEGQEVFIEGVASTSNPDLGNDIISETALMQMADEINSKSTISPVPLGYDHTEFLGGKPTTVPLGHLFKAWVENGKLFVKGTLNKALSIFNEAKSALERKDLNAYSIEYIADPDKTRFDVINGVKHRIIDGIKLLGIALTGRPMNQESYANFYYKHLVGEIPEIEEKKTPLGEGSRFKEVVNKVKGRTNKRTGKPFTEEEAGAIAASIGRKKYGKKKFQALAKKSEDDVPDEVYNEVTDEDINQEVDNMEEVKKETLEVKSEEVKPVEVKSTEIKVEKPVEVKNKPILDDAPKFEAKTNDTPLKRAIVEMKSACLDPAKKLSYGPMGQIDIDPSVQFKAAAKLHDAIIAARGSRDGGLSNGGTVLNPEFRVTGGASQDIQVKHVEFKAWSDGDGQLAEYTHKVSDTDYYQTSAELHDVYIGPVINTLNDKTTTYGLLRKVNASNVGDKYGRVIIYAHNSSAQNIGETDITSSSIFDREDMLKVQQPFMQYAIGIQVSDKMIADGRGGGSSVGDIWATQMQWAAVALKKKLNQELHDSSSASVGFTAGGQLMSLASITSYDGSTGSDVSPYGHSQDNASFGAQLRSAYVLAAGTTDITKQRLRTLIRKCVEKGAEKNNLAFICDYTQQDKILGLLDEHQRINNTSPRAGFEGMPTFDGVPIHADVDCSSGYLYCIDTSVTYIIVQQAPTIVELAKNGLERRAVIVTYLNMFVEAPTHNALITGLKTT